MLGNSPTSFLPLPHPSLTSVQSQPVFHPPHLYCPSLLCDYSQSCGLCASSTTPSFFFCLSPHKVIQCLPILPSFWLPTLIGARAPSWDTACTVFPSNAACPMYTKGFSHSPPIFPLCLLFQTRLQLTFLSFSAPSKSAATSCFIQFLPLVFLSDFD